MSEPPALVEARRRLKRAEADLHSPECLAELGHALALLDDVLQAAAPRHREVARNLIAAYRTSVQRRVEERLAAEHGPPEPELEHLLRVLLAFDRAPGAAPEGATAAKIEIARRLVEHYYEGHPAERKQRALDELTALAQHAGARSRSPG